MSGPSEFFQAIRQRPAMYIGEGPPLTCLHAFLMGHQLGCGNDPNSPLALPNDFSGWVAYRTGADSTYNWHGMLLSQWPDERDAFKRFFELLEEHQSRKGRLIAKVAGHREFPARDGVTKSPSLARGPIFLTTYTRDPGFLATDSEGYTFGIWGNWKSWRELSEKKGFTEEHLEILDRAEFERVRA